MRGSIRGRLLLGLVLALPSSPGSPTGAVCPLERKIGDNAKAEFSSKRQRGRIGKAPAYCPFSEHCETMASSLADLNVLRTAIGQLNAERRAGLGKHEGETRYQPRAEEFHKRLSLEVASRRGKARTLVTGQIGVGKSSELWQFFHDQTRECDEFVVFCDLEQEEHPERCGATGVFLTIFRDCWSETKRFQGKQHELAQLRGEILTRLIDWLGGHRVENEQKVLLKFGGMDFPVFLNKPDTALSLILGKAAQHEAVSEASDRFGIVPDSLINLLNKLLDWFTSQIRGKAPLLIIDHVDKIRDAAAAEDVLVKAVPHWNRIRASIIMTAPFEHTLGELRGSVESKWGRPIMLYPVPIPDLKSGSIPTIYLEIIKHAGLDALIREESLRMIAHYSGGILRSYVQFLIESCKQSHLAGHDRIELPDVRNVIQDAEIAYRDYATKELALLEEISSTGTGLGEAATLLRSPIGLIVAEPRDSDSGLLVHPLAQAALAKYQLKKQKAWA